MSLGPWLKENKMYSCLDGLVEAGVQEPNDLCEFTEDDLKELSETLKWNLLTRRRVINAIAKLKEQNNPEPIQRQRPTVNYKTKRRTHGRHTSEPRSTSLDNKNLHKKIKSGSGTTKRKKKTRKANLSMDGRKVTKYRGNWKGDEEKSKSPKYGSKKQRRMSEVTRKAARRNISPRKKRANSVKELPNAAVTYHKSVNKRLKVKPALRQSRSETVTYEVFSMDPKRSGLKDVKSVSPRTFLSTPKLNLTPARKSRIARRRAKSSAKRHTSVPNIVLKNSQSSDATDEFKHSPIQTSSRRTTARIKRDKEAQPSCSPMKSTLSRPSSSDDEISEFSLMLTPEDDEEYVFDLNQCVPVIPELPILSDTRDVVQAIGNLMLDCQNPRVKWEGQRKIGLVVTPLKAKCTPEFQELLCEEEDVSASRLRKQIKRLVEFKEEINQKRSELEQYLKALEEEPNPFGDINVFLEEQRELEETLENHKEFAKEYQSAREAHEKAKLLIECIDQETFAEMRSMKRPPQALQDVITGVLILCGVQDISWANCKRFICDKHVKKQLLEFDPRTVTRRDQKRCKQWLSERTESFDEDRVFKVNRAAVPLALWVKGLFAIVKVYQRLESFKDGEKVIEAISNATTRHKQLEETIANCRRMDQYMQSIKDQLIFDIELLRSCETILNSDIGQKEKILADLVIDLKRPNISETELPPEYVKPFDDTCRKMKARYGDMTEVEMKYTFMMLKKYFVLLIRFYKTYAGMEGKLGQGLAGMSSLMWGVCTQALDLQLTADDENRISLPNIFDQCAVTILASDEKEVEEDERKSRMEGNTSPDMGLTGIWRCGNQLWTLTQSTPESFHGFIQNENFAIIKGFIEDDDLMVFTVKWQPSSDKPGQVAKCKAAYSKDVIDLRIRYKTNKGKSGVWEVAKTAGKMRTQQKGTSTLQYDNFVEAMLRVGIQLNPAMQPWEALEHLMLKHVLPKALARWNVDPKDPSLKEVLLSKKNKKTLNDVFRAYSHTRKDKKSGRLLSYAKWEQFCKDLIKVANKAGSNFERPSFRVQQFAFFTSNALFSLTDDVVLNELSSSEFPDGVVRLAFKMVLFNQRRSRRSLPAVSSEDSGDIVKKTEVAIRWLESIAKSRR